MEKKKRKTKKEREATTIKSIYSLKRKKQTNKQRKATNTRL